MTKTVTSERIEEIRRWLADETKLDPYWYPEEIVSICAELLQRRGTVEPSRERPVCPEEAMEEATLKRMEQPCLFCGSVDELLSCPCGGDVRMNLNDIDYVFFCSCDKCGRGMGAGGKSPKENHDECVRRWNVFICAENRSGDSNG